MYRACLIGWIDLSDLVGDKFQKSHARDEGNTYLLNNEPNKTYDAQGLRVGVLIPLLLVWWVNHHLEL